MREPRSKFYDGRSYGRLVEPLLAGVHSYLLERMPPGDRVLDACCGTGALARRMAAGGRQVVGVDLSPRNIADARGRSRDATGVAFEIGDVSTLQPPAQGPYDVATVVMALHEMPADARAPVLDALLRTARSLMVVDFAVPMPLNLAGVRNRAVELVAGPEHFAAFRDFYRRGGLGPLYEASGADIGWDRHIDSGTLRVSVLRAAGDR